MSESKYRVVHPVRAVVRRLNDAQERATAVTLTLQEGCALLTHVRRARAVALQPTPRARQGRDRRLLSAALVALEHVRDCGACGEDSLESCAGGRHALRTIAAIKLAVGLP